MHFTDANVTAIELMCMSADISHVAEVLHGCHKAMWAKMISFTSSMLSMDLYFHGGTGMYEPNTRCTADM